MNYFKNRIVEIYTLISAMREASIEDGIQAKSLLEEIKAATEDEERIALIKVFKKLEFFNHLRTMEMDKMLPIIIDLISLAVLEDIDTGLTEDQISSVNAAKERFVPLFIFEKNTLKFFNPDMEAIVDAELNNPERSDIQAFNKLIKGLGDVK